MLKASLKGEVSLYAREETAAFFKAQDENNLPIYRGVLVYQLTFSRIYSILLMMSYDNGVLCGVQHGLESQLQRAYIKEMVK